MLALNGIETWGLEISQKAVGMANQNIELQLASPLVGNFGEGEKPSEVAPAKVILGDFFKHDWEGEIGKDFEGFDLIYDYTVCPETSFRAHTLTRPVPLCVAAVDAT